MSDIYNPYPCFGERCWFAENAIEDSYGTRYYSVLNWGAGVFHTWMIVFGVLIYRWYPGMLRWDTWWSNQCPL